MLKRCVGRGRNQPSNNRLKKASKKSVLKAKPDPLDGEKGTADQTCMHPDLHCTIRGRRLCCEI